MEVATTNGGREGAVMAPPHMATEVVVVELAMVVGKTKTVTVL